MEDTTREYYVRCVYEAEEINLTVEIENKEKRSVQIDTILYNAIIGFHNKEYFDICLKNL